MNPTTNYAVGLRRINRTFMYTAIVSLLLPVTLFLIIIVSLLFSASSGVVVEYYITSTVLQLVVFSMILYGLSLAIKTFSDNTLFKITAIVLVITIVTWIVGGVLLTIILYSSANLSANIETTNGLHIASYVFGDTQGVLLAISMSLLFIAFKRMISNWELYYVLIYALIILAETVLNLFLQVDIITMSESDSLLYLLVFLFTPVILVPLLCAALYSCTSTKRITGNKPVTH